MSKNTIVIENTDKDLDGQGLSWKKESYDERYNKIISFIKEKTGGFPSANMQPIRKMTISVTGDTTILMVKVFVKDIFCNFGLDCFQICLDQSNSKVELLFDWYDRSAGQCRYIYKTLQKKIEVMAIQHLCLPCDSKNDELLRLYLKNAYRQNKNIYRDLLEKLGNAKIGRESYRLLDILITYVELVCQGKVK